MGCCIKYFKRKSIYENPIEAEATAYNTNPVEVGTKSPKTNFQLHVVDFNDDQIMSEEMSRKSGN